MTFEKFTARYGEPGLDEDELIEQYYEYLNRQAEDCRFAEDPAADYGYHQQDLIDSYRAER